MVRAWEGRWYGRDKVFHMEPVTLSRLIVLAATQRGTIAHPQICWHCGISKAAAHF